MPTTFRVDEFARTPDAALNERDRTRFTSLGFDLAAAPPPVLARFRLDEFALTADGALNARDRTRFTGVGFDLVAATPESPLGGVVLVVPGRLRTFPVPRRSA